METYFNLNKYTVDNGKVAKVHKVVENSTLDKINQFARSAQLSFRANQSMFGGYWIHPKYDDCFYEIDIVES